MPTPASNPTPIHPAIEPLLVSAPRAAEILSISTRTLWQLTAERKIPSMKVGKRRTLYSPEALRAWIAAQQTEVA